MALISINGLPVIKGTIYMPRIGAWHAELVVDAEDTMEGEATILCADQLELVGTINRFKPYVGMAQVRVVAGSDGLRNKATPKFYKKPTIRRVLADLVSNADAAVSDQSEDAVLNKELDYWTTIETTVGTLIAALVMDAPADTAWRFLPDGTLWVGREEWPEAGVTEWVKLSEDGISEAFEIATIAPVVLPGTVIDDKRIGYVEHRIESDVVRSIAWTVP